MTTSSQELPSIKGKTIAVLKGGPGSEREVSLESAKSVSAALAEKGAEVVEIDVVSEAFDVPETVDVAFNVIHGTFGEDGGLQRTLEEQGGPLYWSRRRK